MKCDYFDQLKCYSCPNIALTLEVQLSLKQEKLQLLMQEHFVENFLSPCFGQETGFRNKAKMVALGAAHQPILGLMTLNKENNQEEPVSLCFCPLYPEDMQRLLKRLEGFIQQAGLPPYNIEKMKGELKYVLLTRSKFNGHYLLRFVLRTKDAIKRIERELPKLLSEYPKIKVVSVNIQPIHQAILEGNEEIFLTKSERIEEVFNQIPLYIRPKSFFQTNPRVAEQLYYTAQEWSSSLKPNLIWDLFCGVGGFGLHCASYALNETRERALSNKQVKQVRLVGIEIEPEAIACAKDSALRIGIDDVTFRALDSTLFSSDVTYSLDLDEREVDIPDLIIVNPPRRGLGEALCSQLTTIQCNAILYSSCNPETLVKDLSMIKDYRIEKVQLFDLFPHTDHFEVLVLLIKNKSATVQLKDK